MPEQRGNGALTVEQQAQVIEMLKSGRPSQKDVAEQFGVTKNTIAGIWSRFGQPGTRYREPTTLGQRLDALHATLDRVLTETTGVGRIPEPERETGR